MTAYLGATSPKMILLNWGMAGVLCNFGLISPIAELLSPAVLFLLFHPLSIAN